jgi:hypothetical protein
MSQPKQTPTGDVFGEVVNLSQGSVVRVEAGQVRMKESRVRQVGADEVDLQASTALQVNGRHVDARASTIGSINARVADVNNSSLLAARMGDTAIEKSTIGAMFVDSAVLSDSRPIFLVSRQVQGDPVQATVLLAGRIDGPVHTVLDTPRSLLAGLAFGAGFGLITWALNRLSRSLRK